MMKYILTFLLTFFVTPLLIAEERSILATVDDTPITYKDIEYRKRILGLSNNLHNLSPEAMAMMEGNILQQLINEAVIAHEAKRLKISVPPEELRKAEEHIMEEFQVTPDRIVSFLKAHQIPEPIFRAQIESDLLWAKVINNKIRPYVVASQRDIMAQLNTITTPHTRISLKELRMDFSDKISKQRAYQALNQFREMFSGCVDFESRASKLQPVGTATSLTESMENLQPSLRSLVMSLPISYPSHIIEGYNSAKIVVVCNRDNYHHQTRTDAENAVQEQRAMQKAGLYLAKLRKKAYIRFYD